MHRRLAEAARPSRRQTSTIATSVPITNSANMIRKATWGPPPNTSPAAPRTHGKANRSVNADPMSVCGNPGAAAAIRAYVCVSSAWVAAIPAPHRYQWFVAARKTSIDTTPAKTTPSGQRGPPSERSPADA